MRILLAILLSALSANAATVTFPITNALGVLDTNYVKVTGGAFVIDGSWMNSGIATRVYPSNGVPGQISLGPGTYAVTNSLIGLNVIRVPNTANTYSFTRLRIYNTNGFSFGPGVLDVTSSDGSVQVSENETGVKDLKAVGNPSALTNNDPRAVTLPNLQVDSTNLNANASSTIGSIASGIVGGALAANQSYKGTFNGNGAGVTNAPYVGLTNGAVQVLGVNANPLDLDRKGIILTNATVFLVLDGTNMVPLIYAQKHPNGEIGFYMGGNADYDQFMNDTTNVAPRSVYGTLRNPRFNIGWKLAQYYGTNPPAGDIGWAQAVLQWQFDPYSIHVGDPNGTYYALFANWNQTNVIQIGSSASSSSPFQTALDKLILDARQVAISNLFDASAAWASMTFGDPTGGNVISTPVAMTNSTYVTSTNNFKWDGHGTLTNLIAGYYAISASVSFNQDNAGNDGYYNMAIYTNGVRAGMFAYTYAVNTVSSIYNSPVMALAPQTFYLPANSWVQVKMWGDGTQGMSSTMGVLDIVKRQ